MNQAHDIRGKYVEIIQAIAKTYQRAYSESAHLIPADATFAQCLGYTLKYIVGKESDRPHYRYDIYRDALREAPVNLETDERLVHVDVGCGPGLFTWVVRDHFRAYPQIALELHGYDHSPKMAELANSIWRRLEEETPYSCHHHLEDLFSAAMSVRPSTGSVLVTFGHVLVQTIDDDLAVNDFSSIVETFATLGDCRMLAVDARSGSRREAFRKACENLAGAIEQRGMVIAERDIPTFGSRMFARIGTRE